MPCRFCNDEGWICQSHRQPRGHDGCDYEAIEPCPDPACENRGRAYYDEIFATTRRRDDERDKDE